MHALVYSDWQVKFGHPTLSIIHYFKRQDINYPEVSNINSDVQADNFINILYTVLCFPDLNQSKHLSSVASNYAKAWKCPCVDGSKCGPLCRALKTRLSILQTTIAILKYNGMHVLVNHAYAHLDAHMPLLCAIQSYQASLQPGQFSCSERHMMHLIEHAPIDLQWAFTEETVPDTSPLLLLSISYNNHTKGISNKRIFQSKFPHLNDANIVRIHKLVNLIYKGLPNRCNNRELWNFIRRCCVSSKPKKKSSRKASAAAAAAALDGEEQDASQLYEIDVDLIEFFCKLLIASVLGIYRGSQNKMDDIASRQNIYNMLHAPVPIEQVLGVMNPHNKITLLYIVKEYLRAMTDRSPGVLQGLKKIFDWDIYDRHIDEITTLVRQTVQYNMTAHSETMTSLNDIFNGSDARITSIHDESRRSQREKTVNYDVYAIIKACKDMNLKAYIERDNEHGQFTGKEFLMQNPHPTLPPDLVSLMRQLIRTFPSHHWVPLDWLVCFGVSWKDVRAVSSALFKKMTVLIKLLKHMQEHDPPSYAIFYTFFRLCKEHRDYREYYADAHMYMCHARALNTYHGIKPGAHIPKVLGKLQVCPTCGDFKRPSFFRPLKRNKNGGGVGITRVCLDGRTVCGRKIKRAGWRAKKNANRQRRRIRKQKLLTGGGRSAVRLAGVEDDMDVEFEDMEEEDYYGDGEFDPMKEIEEEFNVQLSRHKREYDEDDDEDSDDDDDDAGFMYEEKKGGVTQPSERTKRRKIAKFIATQHVLNECQETETITINTLGRVAEWQRQEMISCMLCIRTITLLSATDMGPLKLCQDCYFKESTSLRKKIKCEAIGCKKKLQNKADFRVIYAYDDMVPLAERKFRDVILCTLHSSFAWITKSPAVLRVSVIMRGISEKWGTKNGPKGKYIEVPEFDKVAT